MADKLPHQSDLDQIVELNRLFLRLIKQRAEAGYDCLGLGRVAVAELRAAEWSRVDRLADLPRALFRIQLGEVQPPALRDSSRSERDAAMQSLQLTALLTAWNFSRRSGYAARLFLGLTPEQIAALRAVPLSDLPPLAALPGLVRCAFEDLDRLWQGLLADTPPEQRRHLLLVALQPQIATQQTPRQAFAS